MPYLNLLDELRLSLKEDTISLFYHGLFDDAFTDKFISIVAFDSERRVKGKMAFVMAESFQNVVRHRDKTLDQNNANSFAIRGRKNWMHIFSSNLVNKEVKSILQNNLNNINTYDKDELKAAYMSILEKGELSEKGGAGMGLIEMARRSKNPIQFEFISLSNGAHTFNMQVDFERGEGEITQPVMPISENSKLNKLIIDEDILFVYNGEFSDEVLEPMIPIMETNAAVEGTAGYSIFHIAVELMQNIGRHGVLNVEGHKTGLFALKKLEDGYYFCSGNYTESALDDLKKYVLELNVCEEAELNDLYKKALKESVVTDVNSARVGLIDIRRTAKNPIDIKIIQDGTGKYVMIGVKLST